MVLLVLVEDAACDHHTQGHLRMVNNQLTSGGCVRAGGTVGDDEECARVASFKEQTTRSSMLT